ncbi:MAG: hypothetical protein ACYTFW_09490 [Planctomycetota bacterium]|jgi:hypothetical protein
MISAKTKAYVKMNICVILTLWMLVAVPSLGEDAIDWYTIDGGGGTSTGGPYTLTGTIGQPDAGWSIGGIYELLGGFCLGGPLPECYTGGLLPKN